MPVRSRLGGLEFSDLCSVYYCMETKTCSKCNIEKSLNNFYKQRDGKHSYCKPCLLEVQKQRWIDRKYKMIEIMGGKCTECGYDKYYGALELHHLDPKTKLYNWTKLKELSWKIIIEELKKCVLLCANCHREHHDLIRNVKYSSKETGNNLLDKSTMLPTGQCPTCQTDVFGTKFCSVPCVKLSKRKPIRPSKEELEALLKAESYCAIGRKYDVSDNTIRKWVVYYDISLSTAKYAHKSKQRPESYSDGDA